MRRSSQWLVRLSALLLALPVAASDAEIAAALKRAGVRAVEPASVARDFQLPRLSGGQLALSEARGQWVLLTFFATWCGPCRTELPTLERLSRQRSGQGVTVLGVSVDDSRDKLPAFVSKLGLSFPVVWDSRGSAARDYKASSIPISYVIDPSGRIRGVSRGYKDWGKKAALFDALLSLMPADDSAPSLYAQPGAAVDLPSTLTPPTATVSLAGDPPRAGQPFGVDVKISWAGNFQDYVLHPPEVTLPEGIERREISAVTSSADGRSVVTYRVQLQGDKPGRYALDPVELRYTPLLESSPLASRIKGLTVEIPEARVLGLKLPHFAASLAGLGLVVGAGLLLGKRRQRRSQRAGSREPSRLQALEARFEAARRQRLGGDIAGYLGALSELELELSPEVSSDRADLDRSLEAVRFGGQPPRAEELDIIQRRVERQLSALREQETPKARASIELADPVQPSARPER